MSPGTTDTIAAISTPPGEGGVGIVRLSGPRALEIASSMFVSAHGKAPLESPRQRVFHGRMVDGAGRTLDEALLHLMRAPRSYTAEDVAEINAHGGAAPLRAILEEALRRGARLARPGEFTRRAFLNGRIDLARAEAVMDQIRARTDAALQAANAAASGALSREIYRLRGELADALARVEAAVDFPEEDLPELVDAALFARVEAARGDMERLLATSQTGRLYREGAEVALAGRPNVGKSSLFNALLRDTRAIVSELPGTTRDTIGEEAQFGGVPVRLVDTAGIRETGGEIERVGVDLARRAAQNARLVLFVMDAASGWTPEDLLVAGELLSGPAPVLAVANKCDLCGTGGTGVPPVENMAGTAMPHGTGVPPENMPPSSTGVPPMDLPPFTEILRVSAKTGEGLAALDARITETLLGGDTGDAGTPMISRLHQEDSLRRALAGVVRFLEERHLSPELLAFELREALYALGEITGETTPEELLDRIFANFCVGK
ncbi:MAG: tRNA uridine-5-carboxymethylaminomethyl(34) synthesis GTPase MnmE [Candidatus Hydrogenedens sp.]|nr:tRNA uridine-5-carboxymethylaminomethyl(34) synthesis GTPase MnmE [Candidatus Hydrogenedens sp.]